MSHAKQVSLLTRTSCEFELLTNLERSCVFNQKIQKSTLLNFFNQTIKITFISFLISSLVLIYGCENNHYSIAIANRNTTLNPIGTIIANQLQQELSIEMTIIDTTSTAYDNFLSIESGKADLAIASNTFYHPQEQAYKFKNVRTIIPLFRMVFIVLYPDTITANSITELLSNKRVGIGPPNSNTARICIDIFRELGVEPTQYTPVYSSFETNVLSDTIDVCCYFTGLFNQQIQNMLSKSNAQIFSLERENINPILFQSGSSVTGISKKMWTYSTYIIPRQLYKNKPKEPIYTLALQGCLYGSESLNEEFVYSVVESIVNNKSFYMKQNSFFQDIDPSYTDNYFYPLHKGAIRYKERDKPSFLEKNSEILSFFVSLIALVSGIVSPIIANRRRKRKQKLELMAQELLKLSSLQNISSKSSEATIEKIKKQLIYLLETNKGSFDNNFQNLLTVLKLTELQVLNHSEKIKEARRKK